MAESPLSGQVQLRTPSTVWPSARLLVHFVLDIADIARRGGPVLDTLILTVVMEANLVPLNQDPVLQRRYSGLDSPPPDELRRPVSISAVAASLSLPFETVRRHLTRLADIGECVIGPKGVVVPTERLTSPDYGRTAAARYDRTRRLYRDLKAIGAIPGAAAVPQADLQPALAGPDAPVRLCDRLLSEFYLRVIDLQMRRVGDPVAGLIVLGLARANMAALDPEGRAAADLLPEAARQPVRRSALAEQLGLPAETVRRRLIDLERRGYCRSSRAGIMISMEAVTRPESLRLMQENQANLIRFITRLRRSGLLVLWDAELATASVGG